MLEYWNAFIVGFCKVEFLCYAGSPNWLGWAVIGFGCLSFLIAFCAILLAAAD